MNIFPFNKRHFECASNHARTRYAVFIDVVLIRSVKLLEKNVQVSVCGFRLEINSVRREGGREMNCSFANVDGTGQVVRQEMNLIIKRN